jgi:hypothetical protein
MTFQPQSLARRPFDFRFDLIPVGDGSDRLNQIPVHADGRVIEKIAKPVLINRQVFRAEFPEVEITTKSELVRELSDSERIIVESPTALINDADGGFALAMFQNPLLCTFEREMAPSGFPCLFVAHSRPGLTTGI